VWAWGPKANVAYAANFTLRAKKRGVELRCLGRTKSGAPRHPLYVRADAKLEAYQ